MMAFTVPPPTEPTTVAYRPLVVPVTVSLSPSSVHTPLLSPSMLHVTAAVVPLTPSFQTSPF